MRRLHRGGQTIILVTHDPDVAGAAQRVVRMRDGRIVDPEPAMGGTPSSGPGDHGSGGPGPGARLDA